MHKILFRYVAAIKRSCSMLAYDGTYMCIIFTRYSHNRNVLSVYHRWLRHLRGKLGRPYWRHGGRVDEQNCELYRQKQRLGDRNRSAFGSGMACGTLCLTARCFSCFKIGQNNRRSTTSQKMKENNRLTRRQRKILRRRRNRKEKCLIRESKQALKALRVLWRRTALPDHNAEQPRGPQPG